MQAASEREPPPPLKPSSALSGADALDSQEPADSLRPASSVQRGVLVHQLMQGLPALAVEQRAAAAIRYLRAQAPQMNPEAAGALADEVVAALALTEAAPLFGANSRGEAAIAARIPREGLETLDIAGRIDRLAEVDEEVWIADFKTGAPPVEPPPAYVAQLALYRAGLREIYPARIVRAFILWTAAPRLQEIPAGAMEAALAEI